MKKQYILFFLIINTILNNICFAGDSWQTDIKNCSIVIGVIFAIAVPSAYIKNTYFPTPPDPKDLQLKQLKEEKKNLAEQNKLLQHQINETNQTQSTLSTKLHPEEKEAKAKTEKTLQEKLEGEKNPFLVPNRNPINPIYLNQNYNIRASSCKKETNIDTFFEQNIHKKLPETNMTSRITERTEFSPSKIWTSA